MDPQAKRRKLEAAGSGSAAGGAGGANGAGRADLWGSVASEPWAWTPNNNKYVVTAPEAVTKPLPVRHCVLPRCLALRHFLNVADGPLGSEQDEKIRSEIAELVVSYFADPVPDPEHELPPGMWAKLKPYQREATRWGVCKMLGTCLMAHEMGLGKTPLGLAILYVLVWLEGGRALIACSKSSIKTWIAEIGTWLGVGPVAAGKDDDGTVVELKGVGDKCLKAGQTKVSERVQALRRARLVVTTYPGATKWSEELQAVRWDMLVLDESQNLKHSGSLRTSLFTRLSRGARHCVLLSGSPMDVPANLWSQVQIVRPDLWPNERDFNERYCNPKDKRIGTKTVREYKGLTAVHAQELNSLLVRYVMDRRTKADSGLQLPELTRTMTLLDMPQRCEKNSLPDGDDDDGDSDNDSEPKVKKRKLKQKEEPPLKKRKIATTPKQKEAEKKRKERQEKKEEKERQKRERQRERQEKKAQKEAERKSKKRGGPDDKLAEMGAAAAERCRKQLRDLRKRKVPRVLDYLTRYLCRAGYVGEYDQCLLDALSASVTRRLPDGILGLIADYYKPALPPGCLLWGLHLRTLDSLENLASTLGIGCVRIDGSKTALQRQSAIERFQRDPKCRLAVLGIDAAATSITLTRATKAIFAEMHPLMTVMIQAESRNWRIGQEYPVSVEYLVVPQSVDQRLFSLISQKYRFITTVVDAQEQKLKADRTKLSDRDQTTLEFLPQQDEYEDKDEDRPPTDPFEVD